MKKQNPTRELVSFYKQFKNDNLATSVFPVQGTATYTSLYSFNYLMMENAFKKPDVFTPEVINKLTLGYYSQFKDSTLNQDIKERLDNIKQSLKEKETTQASFKETKLPPIKQPNWIDSTNLNSFNVKVKNASLKQSLNLDTIKLPVKEFNSNPLKYSLNSRLDLLNASKTQAPRKNVKKEDGVKLPPINTRG